MRIKAAIFMSLSALVLLAFADDQLSTLKVGDITYSNVTVLRVTATDLYFSSSSGICNVKLRSLAPDLQARFAPEAEKAAELEQKQVAATTQYEQALAQQPPSALATGDQLIIPSSGPNALTSTNALAKPFLNERAPELPALQWLSASPDFAQKCVLLNFWATTNDASVKYIPKLNELLDKYGSRLVILGVASQPMDEVQTQTNPMIGYSSAADPDNNLVTALELKKLPYALLLDTNRIVRWEGNPLDPTNALTEPIIAGMLDKYAAPTNAPAVE